ncbi:hypothetical protein DSM3645_28032 [Blastopirellula marina DSM 3645]|uniref:Uncharacterized protein n=1 Tax=Blastopirellula marina DSM 3645 TaxID=314230 RepID=A3ZP32_9BACT|nr:hypothetical protein DSM3645_28032 [Blastopirellula marina DSM 3645]
MAFSFRVSWKLFLLVSRFGWLRREERRLSRIWGPAPPHGQ